MREVHISQFYSASKVELGSELFYICELGKYLSYNDCSLSLDGVILSSVLKKSKFWQYLRVAYANKWVCNVNIDSYDLEISIINPLVLDRVKNVVFTEEEVVYSAEEFEKRQNNYNYNILTPEKLQVCFTSKNDDTWIWDIGGSSSTCFSINTKNLNSEEPSQSWITLVAYVSVTRYLTSVPKKFILYFDSNILSNKSLSVCDLLLLSEETQALDGWCLFNLDCTDSEGLRLGYESWWYKGKEQGFLCENYTNQEKINYMTNTLGIQKGDVVSYYERNANQKNNNIKTISAHHFAIVRGWTSTGVTLEVINTQKTKFGITKWFSNLTMAVKRMYGRLDDCIKFNSRTLHIDFMDLGIEYLMLNELHFITPIQNSDSSIMDVTDGNIESKLCVPTTDAIYWVLKDFEVEFNENHFKKEYFGDSKSLYECYMEGNPLSEYEVEC